MQRKKTYQMLVMGKPQTRIGLLMLCLMMVTACGSSSTSTDANRAVGSSREATFAVNALTNSEAAGGAVKDTSRIVSVGGSVTETIYALGADANLIGVDSSSLYPAEATRLPQVGYMRQLSSEGVLSLKPTLVLAAEDAGTPAAIEQVKAAGVPVVSVPSKTSIDGVRRKIEFLAQTLNRQEQGRELIKRLDNDLHTANTKLQGITDKPRVLFIYARGAGAPNVSGTGTSADEMIRLAGGVNAITEFENYKPLTPEAVVAAAPDIVLFPSRGLESIGGVEGALKLPGIAQTPAGKNRRIIAQDDLLLLGFGTRTGAAVLELIKLFHNK